MKQRRNPKNEGRILQKEVQRYKDKEKIMQNEDGSTTSNKRITIHQGIYGNGCTSGAVSREIRLSKESKARAEANLSRILELAHHAPVDRQSKATLTTISPHRSFLTKENGSPRSSQNENVSAKKRKVEEPCTSRMSSSGSSNSEAAVELPSERQMVSIECCQTVTTGVASESTRAGENKIQESPPKSRKCKTDAKKMKTDISEGTEQKPPPKVKRILYEPLAAGVKDCLVQKCNSFGRTRDLCFEVLEKIHQKYEECVKNRMSPSPGSDTADVINVVEKKNAPTKATRKSGDQSKNDLEVQALDVMRTPSSIDYLKVDEDSGVSGQRRNKVSERESSLGTIVCPGSTIISPRSLLKHYEEKIHRDSRPSHSSKAELRCGSDRNECLVGSDYIPNSSRSFVRSKTNIALRGGTGKCFPDVKDLAKENRMLPHHHGIEPGCSDRIEHMTSPSQSTGVSHSKCPKTIMVDAFHYLERCEQQYDNQQRTDNMVNADRDYLFNYSVDKEWNPQHSTVTEPQTMTKSSLDHSGPFRRKYCGESMSQPSERLGHESIEENSYPVRRSESVIRDRNCSQSNVHCGNSKSNFFEEDDMMTVLPFSSGTTMTGESGRGQIPFSHVSSTSICTHPAYYQSLSSSQCSSQCYPSDAAINSSFPEEQVHDGSLQNYSPQNYQPKVLLPLPDPVFHPSCQGGALQQSRYSNAGLDYRQEISSDEVFPLNPLKNQQSWTTRPQDLLYPSTSLSSHKQHLRSASLPRTLSCRDTLYLAGKQSEVQTCQQLNNWSDSNSDPNLYSVSSLPAEGFQPHASQVADELPEESIFICDVGRTQGWPHQSTKCQKRSGQHGGSVSHASASVPSNVGCSYDRYSGTKTYNENSLDEFQDQTHHVIPDHQS
ncbi:uncharacterized protein [Panulirus ornatus]|uniref:uncharacterized protein isoform X2 n=1 Tax=Panulirus ornatus TaxID=150431 RepID=UPI003A847B6B